MKWVTMWGNAQSTVLPAPAKYAKNLTLRYPIMTTLPGDKIRITLDNYCCPEEVVISKVVVATSDEFNDTQNSEVISVTFNGKEECRIQPHGTVVSDEINISLEYRQTLVVSLYLADYTNLTSGVDIKGPLSKGYFAYGNQINNSKLDINTSKSTSWVYFLANIDVFTSDDSKAIICYGDSITSQDWPDYMMLHIMELGYKNYSVVRKAVSGTRILRQYECITYQSYGLKGENRFVHEVSSVSGAEIVVIQHGINDIIHPVGTDVNIFRPMSDMPTSEELIEGLKYYIKEAEYLGLKPVLATLLPIYGWRTYNLEKEQVKNEVNAWIRTYKDNIDIEKIIGKTVYGCIDFAAGCDSGDHLHPSKLAYQKIGKAVAEAILKK